MWSLLLLAVKALRACPRDLRSQHHAVVIFCHLQKHLQGTKDKMAIIFRQNRCKQSLPPHPRRAHYQLNCWQLDYFFFHCDISVILLTIVLELAVTVFISLYFQTFWRKWLNYFGYFKMVLVYDWKTTEKNSSAKATHRFGLLSFPLLCNWNQALQQLAGVWLRQDSSARIKPPTFACCIHIRLPRNWRQVWFLRTGKIIKLYWKQNTFRNAILLAHRLL